MVPRATASARPRTGAPVGGEFRRFFASSSLITRFFPWPAVLGRPARWMIGKCFFASGRCGSAGTMPRFGDQPA